MLRQHNSLVGDMVLSIGVESEISQLIFQSTDSQNLYLNRLQKIVDIQIRSQHGHTKISQQSQWYNLLLVLLHPI